MYQKKPYVRKHNLVDQKSWDSQEEIKRLESKLAEENGEIDPHDDKSFKPQRRFFYRFNNSICNPPKEDIDQLLEENVIYEADQPKAVRMDV